MNCSILNNTPFAAQAFPHTDAQGVHSLALVAKEPGSWPPAPRTCPGCGRPSASAPSTAPAAAPLGSLARDEFQAQVLQPRAQQPWPICEPEHVPPKPWFDLLLDACAVSPNGRPASSIDVAVDYERQGRQHRLAALRAFSPRIWIKDFGQLKASELGPSLRIPLLRPFAFGGQTLDARGNSLVDEHNPDGMGLRHGGAGRLGALPWMQALDKPLRYWDDTVAEQALGLGLVPAHHQPRRALQGSFDDAWRQSRAPLLPLDHDPRHRNAAPQSLQLAESPRPGDVLALHHMGTEPLMRFVWPRVALVAQAETAGGTLCRPRSCVGTRWPWTRSKPMPRWSGAPCCPLPRRNASPWSISGPMKTPRGPRRPAMSSRMASSNTPPSSPACGASSMPGQSPASAPAPGSRLPPGSACKSACANSSLQPSAPIPSPSPLS